MAIADITVWELALLFVPRGAASHGTVENTVRNLLDRSGVTVKPVTAGNCGAGHPISERLPSRSGGPLIGATARAEGLALVTRDENIRKSPLLKTIW